MAEAGVMCMGYKGRIKPHRDGSRFQMALRRKCNHFGPKSSCRRYAEGLA